MVSVFFLQIGIYNNSTLSDEYIAAARNLCMTQVALAGYRLANTLDYYFSFISLEQLLPKKSLRGGHLNLMG